MVRTASATTSAATASGRKSFILAADELSEVMGLSPAIDTETDSETIKEEILKAAKEIQPDDVFSKNTLAVLESIGYKKAVAKPTATKKQEEPEDTEPEDTEPEDTEPEDLVTTIGKTAKLVDLKALVTENAKKFPKTAKKLDSFTGFAGPRELRAALYKELGVEPPKVAPVAAPKEAKERKATRAQVMSALAHKSKKEPMTTAEFISEMHSAYGGSENESSFQTKNYLNLLIALELMEEKGDKLSYVG
jgi:hypothetical protein